MNKLFVIVVILYFIKLSLSVDCDLICSNTPCCTVVLTDETCHFDVIIDGECNVPLTLTTAGLKETLTLNQQKVYRTRNIKQYISAVVNINLKSDEQICKDDSILWGYGNKQCKGDAWDTDTFHPLLIEEKYDFTDTYNNDRKKPSMFYMRNVSYIVDNNYEFTMESDGIQTLQLSDKQTDSNILVGITYNIDEDVLVGSYQLTSLSSTFSISNYYIHSHFLPNDINGTGGSQNCSIDMIDTSSIKTGIENLAYVNCGDYINPCGFKKSGTQFSNNAPLNNQICLDLINSSSKVSKNDVPALFKLTTLVHGDTIDPDTYTTKITDATKMTINKYEIGSSCLISLTAEDLLRTFSCDIINDFYIIDGLTTIAGYIHTYQQYRKLEYPCSSLSFDCGTLNPTENIFSNIPPLPFDPPQYVSAGLQKDITILDYWLDNYANPNFWVSFFLNYWPIAIIVCLLIWLMWYLIYNCGGDCCAWFRKCKFEKWDKQYKIYLNERMKGKMTKSQYEERKRKLDEEYQQVELEERQIEVITNGTGRVIERDTYETKTLYTQNGNGNGKGTITETRFREV